MRRLTSILYPGPNFAQYEASAGVPSLVAAARGVVLDVGAGSGNQLPHFTASSITHIYGIEPNAAFAGPLRERVAAAGLEDKYTTIIAGVEDAEAELRAAGVERGGVDTVLCVQVLCSLDEPVAVVRALHEMLRPGGELVFWEHQANERDWLTRQVQGKLLTSVHEKKTGMAANEIVLQVFGILFGRLSLDGAGSISR